MLADVVIEAFGKQGVEAKVFRLADHSVLPGVSTDMGGSDGWPAIHDAITEADILVFATPTWVGLPSSIAQRALERPDAMISEIDDDGRAVAYNKVAGVVVTGNEDGAHHVISEIVGALVDIGFAIPGQSWTYWDRGPGPGPSYRRRRRATTGRRAPVARWPKTSRPWPTPLPQVRCRRRLGERSR